MTKNRGASQLFKMYGLIKMRIHFPQPRDCSTQYHPMFLDLLLSEGAFGEAQRVIFVIGKVTDGDFYSI